MNRRLPILVFLQLVVFATMFLLAGVVHAQLSSQTDVNLSKMTGDQSECAVAKNPTNKLQLFVLCNNASAGLFAARSIDGGATWVYPDPSKTIANGANPALGPAACCDPTLSWDTFGNLFIAYIDNNYSSVVVLLSTDGGQTFTNPTTFGPFCAGCPDQPTIVADNTTAVGAPVAVWIVWHRNAPTGPIVASGAAVTGLGVVGAFSAPQDVPGTMNCSYGDVAISPTGVVVQTCQNPSDNTTGGGTIFVNTKADGLGPNPFAAAVTATTTNVSAFYSIPAQSSRTIDAEAGLAYDRNNNSVSLATPLGLSPHFGRLYLIYTDATAAGSADTNIMLRFSDDNGGTWSNPPIRVNDDATNRSQFFPKIASNRLSGNIAVCWYDGRNSASNTAMQVFCSIATPTGASPTFMANGQISDGASTSSADPNQFGDYSGLAYFQGVAHPAWPDTSNSTGDNPDGTTTFDIYSDRVSGGAAAHEGDPHLTTVNGVHYDFQGAGEFVVLRDYDGLEIQTRQAPIATTFNPGPDAHDGLATCVSLNAAVAARVGGHQVTYQPNISGVPDPSGLQLRVDGDLTTLGANGIDLGSGGRIVKTSANGGIEIDFPDETVMFVTPDWWASQSKWYLNVDVSHTPAVEGVLGVIPPGSWLPALPDGTSMGPMPGSLHQRYVDLYQKFGDAWRVTDKTSLFDYAPGTSTDTFTMRNWPLENPPCVIPETRPVRPVSRLVAQEACRPVTGENTRNNCVFDVMVTGNPGFAKTYLLGQRIRTGSTRTTVTDDGDPTQVGEWVEFSAIVTPNSSASRGVPAGTVQFTLDGSKVGQRVKVDAKGQAKWETSRLKVGEHRVAASYIPSHGSVFMASSSVEKTHTVRRCPCGSGAEAK
ncbi:MAG: Ig-like domain repeat protein [Candidatus Binatia bacterium]